MHVKQIQFTCIVLVSAMQNICKRLLTSLRKRKKRCKSSFSKFGWEWVSGYSVCLGLSLVIVNHHLLMTGTRTESFSTSTFFHQSGSSADLVKPLSASANKQKVSLSITITSHHMHIVDKGMIMSQPSHDQVSWFLQGGWLIHKLNCLFTYMYLMMFMEHSCSLLVVVRLLMNLLCAPLMLLLNVMPVPVWCLV